MRPLRIDFAGSPVRRIAARTSAVGWLLLASALALWIGIAREALDLTRQRATADAARETLQRLARTRLDEQRRHAAPVASTAISPARAVAVNRAIAQLNLPWRDVLDAMETATPPSIALLGLEPDAKRNILKGIAEAANAAAMIGYIERLKREPLFHDVLLTRHEINEQDPNQPLRFAFEARWSEATP